jgi:hypothetical protein
MRVRKQVQPEMGFCLVRLEPKSLYLRFRLWDRLLLLGLVREGLIHAVEEPPHMLVPILPLTGQATSIDNPFMIRNLQLGLFFESLRLSLKPFTESFQKSSVLSRFRPRHVRDKSGRASLLCEQGYIRVFVNLSLLPEPFQHRDVIVSFGLSFLVVYLCPAPS